MVLTMPTAKPGARHSDFDGEKVILCLKLVKALFMDSDEVVERHEEMGMNICERCGTRYEASNFCPVCKSPTAKTFTYGINTPQSGETQTFVSLLTVIVELRMIRELLEAIEKRTR